MKTFKKFQSIAEKQPMSMSGSGSYFYNRPFSMCELKVGLGAKMQSAPGSDRLHYEMLRKLSPESMNGLLTFLIIYGKPLPFLVVGNMPT